MNTAQTNNQKNFEAETLPHLRAAYDFALSMTGNREGAADLVQETYLKAFSHYASYKQGTNCRAWLFQILRNSFVNDYRRKKFLGNLYEKSNEHPSDTDPFESIPSDASNIEQMQSSFGDEMTLALDKLSDIYRTIVILADIEEYQYEEIAAFINCPVGTVRSRLHRARKLLANSLHPYAHDNGFIKSNINSFLE